MPLYHITFTEHSEGDITDVVPDTKLYSSLEIAKAIVSERHKIVDHLDPSELKWNQWDDNTLVACVEAIDKYGDEVPVWSWIITEVSPA